MLIIIRRATVSIAGARGGRPFQSTNRFGHVGGIQLDADILPAQLPGHQSHSPRPEKRIEHKISGSSRGQHARLHQSRRESRNMRTAVGGGVDAPDGASVAGATIVCQFFSGFMLVAIMRGLGQHEQVFVCSRRPVLDALGHDIGFVPDDVTAQIPAAFLQGQRQPPGNTEQILVLQARRIVRANIHRAVGVLLVRCPPAAIAAGVAISYVQPQYAVRFEHPPNFVENLRERLDEPRQRWLQSDLARDAIIAQTPVRR